MTLLYAFPGQGSQSVGMGAEIALARPDLRRMYFETADDVLGMPLSLMCWDGPAEVLRDTAVTQPAIFLCSVVTLHMLRERGLEPDLVMGHSLGEFTALVAAGVLDWEDALRLVRRRGQLMADANANVLGRMAAILGLDVAAIATICARVEAETQLVVEVANENSPDQTVISGHAEAVVLAGERAKEAGALRVLALDVGAPFHCRLMDEVAATFEQDVDAAPFSTPLVPFVSTVTAEVVSDPDRIRELIRPQITSRVRWTSAVHSAHRAGMTEQLEVGPGRVLTGLTKRIERTVTTTHTNTLADLDRACDTLSIRDDTLVTP